MKRAALFLAGVLTGLVAAYYGAWFAVYRHFFRGAR